MDRPPAPWEIEGIKPGDDWDTVIRRGLRAAGVTLLFLSRASVKKTGYFQREVKLALDCEMEKPPDEMYLIPVLLEKCEMPDARVDTVSIGRFQAYALYDMGLGPLVRCLKERASVEATGDETVGVHHDPTIVTLHNRLRLTELRHELKRTEQHIQQLKRSRQALEDEANARLVNLHAQLAMQRAIASAYGAPPGL